MTIKLAAGSAVESAGGLGIPNAADFLKPKPPGSTMPLRGPGGPHAGSGAAPGPARGGDTWNISGVAPNEILPKIEARQNSAQRRQSGAFK
ncbi:hypothetical protein [Mycolicibacterium lutetiense]